MGGGGLKLRRRGKVGGGGLKMETKGKGEGGWKEMLALFRKRIEKSNRDGLHEEGLKVNVRFWG